MSKPIKNLIVETYKKKFDGLTGAVGAVTINTAARHELALAFGNGSSIGGNGQSCGRNIVLFVHPQRAA